MTRGYWHRVRQTSPIQSEFVSPVAIDTQRKDGFEDDDEQSEHIRGGRAQQRDEHAIGEPSVLQLFTQHDAADKDQPHDREREEAGNQPLAKFKELRLARVVVLIPFGDGESRRCQTRRGSLCDRRSAGVGDGLRIGSALWRSRAHAATGFNTALK